MNNKHILAIALISFGSFGSVSADTAIYIDPNTGEITSESPAGDNALSPEDQQMILEQQEGAKPEQVPSPVPGGGIMVDMRK
jgi:hypothetical protein